MWEYFDTMKLNSSVDKGECREQRQEEEASWTEHVYYGSNAKRCEKSRSKGITYINDRKSNNVRSTITSFY